MASEGYIERPVHMRTTAPHEQLTYCVFLIERGLEKETVAARGSGFLIEVGSILYGVTARHVVQERDEKTGKWGELLRPLYVRAIRHQEGGHSSFLKEFASRFFSYEDMFVFHNDATVDAVVFPTYRQRDQPEKTKALPLNWLQPDELVKVGEDVHLFGFPGRYGYEQGLSVVRSGTICYKLSRHMYLLDANAWPGDSGGLVCSKPYFGVPEGTLGTYQWHVGGKIVGLQSAYQHPTAFGLPEVLEPFRLVVSAQAILEIIESEAFKALDTRIRALESRMVTG